MFKNPVFRVIISVLAVIDIVGMLYYYRTAVRIPVEAKEQTQVEASDYVSTSYNVAEDEEEEEETTGTTEEEMAAEGQTVLDPTIYPTLELTETSITLGLGERFNYLNYLKTYQDVDGTDLSRSIRLDGDVNVYQLGTYVATYSVTSRVTGQTTSVDLTVEVVPRSSR